MVLVLGAIGEGEERETDGAMEQGKQASLILEREIHLERVGQLERIR